MASFQLPPHATARLFASHQSLLAAKARGKVHRRDLDSAKSFSSSCVTKTEGPGGAGPAATLTYSINASTTYGPVLIARSIKAGRRGICAILVGREGPELEQDLRRRFPRYNLVLDEACSSHGACADQNDGDEDGDHDDVAICQHLEEGADYDKLKLDLIGTPFQRIVWKALLEIPSGSTETYQQITSRAKLPRKSVRAVANACGQNHIAILVPCHRVVRSDGGMGGYHWGVEMKKKILERERKRKGRSKS